MTSDDLKRLYEDFQDDEIFARESLVVLDKRGDLVPMLHGPAQQRLHARARRQEELQKALRLLFLKSRQVWGSVYVASRIFKRTIMQPGQHSLVLAHDHKSAKNIFDHYKRFHDNYKPFRGVIGLPKLVSDRTDALEYDNGSWIKIHTAGNANIGRSFTLHNVHFSEIGFYGDNARQLIASVMSAVPATFGTEVWGESSPNGVGTEFYEMWQQAVDGRSEWIPEFFGWWEHPEYVMPVEEKHRAGFEGSLSEYERDLRRQYSLTHAQLNWRRWIIANQLNGDEDLFKQEFASNARECWLSSGRPRFQITSIERLPIEHNPMRGGLELYDLGNEKRLRFLSRERGEVTIYRQPQKGREYIIGADTSQGIDITGGKGKADPDFAVGNLADRDTGQVVAKVKGRFTPAEFARQLKLLGIYYFWAQIVPEINNHGWAMVQALLAEEYPRNLIYHRIRTIDQDPQERADLIGFLTTQLTRPQMISVLDEALRTGAIIVYDAETQQELRTFVIHADGKASAAYGCHDDEVISLALLCVGIQEMPRRERPKLMPKAQTQVDNYLRRNQNDQQDRRRS